MIGRVSTVTCSEGKEDISQHIQDDRRINGCEVTSEMSISPRKRIGEELILSLAQQFIDNRWNDVLHYIHTNNNYMFRLSTLAILRLYY